MPALQTSQCQNSLDSLSRWMACCPGNTTDRAPQAPFFFLAVRSNPVVLEGEKPGCISATQDYSVYVFEAFTLPSQALLFMQTSLTWICSRGHISPLLLLSFSVLSQGEYAGIPVILHQCCCYLSRKEEEDGVLRTDQPYLARATARQGFDSGGFLSS